MKLTRLNEGLVSNWSQSLWNVTLSKDNTSLSWLSWLSLQLDGLTLSLSGLSLSLVGLDTVQELLTTLRVLDVLNSEVDTLLNVSVTNHLVDDDTDGGSGNVVDDTGLTVVVLVWHTLLDGTVGLDVNDVTNLVDLQVGREWDGTSLLEVTLESVTSTRSVTTTRIKC